VIGNFECRQSRAQIGIVFLSRRFHFGKSRQGLRDLQVIYHGEVLIEIGKQQHGQIEAAALHAQLSFPQVTLLLLGLNPCLDYVGVRDLAPALQFLTDVEKSSRLGSSALRRRVLALGHDQSVVRLGYSDHQAARGDLGLGPGLRQGGGGAAIVRKIGERDRLMYIRLADVLMYAIVGDELGRWASQRAGGTARGKRACALGVNERIVVVQVGQQSCASLYAIFAG
jgi:hypothetical protein